MNLRRVAIALLSLGLLSGCAAGHDAITIKPYSPTDGNQAQSDGIKVRNALVVLQADGSTQLIATIVNSAVDADTMTGITVNGQPVTLSSASFVLDQNKAVIFGGDSANATGTVASLGAKPGQLVPMVITFAKAASINMSVLVREATGEFATTSQPTPTATTTP